MSKCNCAHTVRLLSALTQLLNIKYILSIISFSPYYIYVCFAGDWACCDVCCCCCFFCRYRFIATIWDCAIQKLDSIKEGLDYPCTLNECVCVIYLKTNSLLKYKQVNKRAAQDAIDAINDRKQQDRGICSFFFFWLSRKSSDQVWNSNVDKSALLFLSFLSWICYFSTIVVLFCSV